MKKVISAVFALTIAMSAMADVSVFGTMDAGYSSTKAPNAATTTTGYTSGGMSGDGNTIQVAQNGTNNTANLGISGGSNTVNINQGGTGQDANVKISGASNTINISQGSGGAMLPALTR